MQQFFSQVFAVPQVASQLSLDKIQDQNVVTHVDRKLQGKPLQTVLYNLA